MWDDDVDFMAIDKEDREETGRRLADGHPLQTITPQGGLKNSYSLEQQRLIKAMQDPRYVLALEQAEDYDSTEDRCDDELTLDELADRIAGSLT